MTKSQCLNSFDFIQRPLKPSDSPVFMLNGHYDFRALFHKDNFGDQISSTHQEPGTPTTASTGHQSSLGNTWRTENQKRKGRKREKKKGFT